MVKVALLVRSEAKAGKGPVTAAYLTTAFTVIGVAPGICGTAATSTRRRS